MLTTSCSLIFTVILFLATLPQPGNSNRGVEVSIEEGGARQSLTTRLETVGDLLRQQGLDAPAYAARSHSPTDRLADGMVIRVRPVRDVTIVAGGVERLVSTALEKPAAILESAGVPLGASDKLWVNGALANVDALPDWTVPARHIEIRRAARLTIIDDGVQSTIMTSAATIGDALHEAGLALDPADQATPAPDTPPIGEMRVHIKRALPVHLIVDGVTIDARSNAARVGAALIELDAPLFGLDYVRPPADTPLSADMTIEIVRVVEDILTESAAIDFEIQTRLDDGLNLDQVAIVQQGRAGRQETRYRVRHENGVEVAREPLETVVAEAPIDKIVAYGAKIVSLGTVPGADLSYWRRVCVIATNYDPESQGGSRETATGATLAKGVIAAKPHIIPYHTSVYVPGYGSGVIRDTGAGPQSTPFWIDLGYGSRAEAQADKAHTRYTWVYHLWPPPEKVIHILPPWRPSVSYPSGDCGA